jgi:hypothetical protein
LRALKNQRKAELLRLIIFHESIFSWLMMRMPTNSRNLKTISQFFKPLIIGTAVFIIVISTIQPILVQANTAAPSNGGYLKAVKRDLTGLALISYNVLGVRFISQTDDGGYITAGQLENVGGMENFAALITKYNSEGNKEWEATHLRPGDPEVVGQSDEAYCILQTGDGYAVVSRSMSTPAGGYDIALYKIDSSGNEKWTSILNTGDHVDEPSFGQSLQRTKDDGYVIIGRHSALPPQPPTVNQYDICLIKTDKSGNAEWNKVIGNVQYNDFGYSIKQTNDDGYIISGSTNVSQDYSGKGDREAYLIKTNKSGDIQWSKTFGGTGNEEARSVQQTSDGGYILAGQTSSFGSGGSDVYLIKTDPDGNEQWSWTYGDGDDDGAYSVVQTSNKGYLIGGYTWSLNDDGVRQKDAYLIKTDANGKMEWAIKEGWPWVDDEVIPNVLSQSSDGDYSWSIIEYPNDETDATNLIIAINTVKIEVDSQPPPLNAIFRVSDLTINPVQAKEGEKVSISVIVTNTGNIEGTDTVLLNVNEQTSASKEVTLKSGESTTVSWQTSSEWVAGVYNVEINGLTDSFEIVKSDSVTVTITISPSKFTIDETTLISGSISPSYENANITIQYRNQGGDWIILDNVYTDQTGSYIYYWNPRSTGTFEVRALLEENGRYDAYSSRIIQVVVDDTSSPCVIVTATYGSKLAPEVVFTRHVRDDLIGASATGEVLVKGWNAFYYSWSPQVAKLIGNSEVLRSIFKVLLTPLLGSMHLVALQYQGLAWLNPDLAAVTAFSTAAILSIGIYVILPVVAILFVFKCIRKK